MEMCTGCIISAYVWASGVFALVWSQCQYLNLNIYGKYLVVWLSFMCKLLKAGGADRSRKSSAGVNDNGYSTDSVRFSQGCKVVCICALTVWDFQFGCLHRYHLSHQLMRAGIVLPERTSCSINTDFIWKKRYRTHRPVNLELRKVRCTLK